MYNRYFGCYSSSEFTNQEYTSLGTAGGIYHFRDRILAGDPDSFFVMNGDVCAQFPLQEMVDFAAESVSDVLRVLKRRDKG